MAEQEDEPGLGLQRWGTRFASQPIEQRFLEWHFARLSPQLRLVMGWAALFWLVCPGTLYAAAVISAIELVVWTVSNAAGIGLASVAVWRRDVRMFRAVQLVGLSLATCATAWILSLHPAFDHGALVLMMGMFVALIVATSTQSLAVVGPSALIGVAFVEWVRVQRWLAGELTPIEIAIESLMLWGSLALGSLSAISSDRAAHVAYRQEQIIELQKQTIARERAQREALLERELSHQVAERSRELGAVLAKSDVTLDVRSLKTGERFAERYEILSPLGAGGMGAVYEVERMTDGERLALKAVVGEVSGASAARFAREAEIGARIRHANLIAIVDVGVSSGVPFLVMELVRGGSLESQRSRFGDVAWALPILKQIAEGLAALHDAGVVHRDLKPANVLVADGVAKISDFGISRFGALEEGTSIDPSADTIAPSPKPRRSELTGTGVVMGTPLYMAPEGARSARALDASADVFAFGILAYEMLSGRSPFPVPAFMLALAEQPIPTPPPIEDRRVPSALASALRDCLASDPSRRPRVRPILTALGRVA